MNSRINTSPKYSDKSQQQPTSIYRRKKMPKLLYPSKPGQSLMAKKWTPSLRNTWGKVPTGNQGLGLGIRGARHTICLPLTRRKWRKWLAQKSGRAYRQTRGSPEVSRGYGTNVMRISGMYGSNVDCPTEKTKGWDRQCKNQAILQSSLQQCF